ncbi:hypothetical protein BLSTO_04113 [Blastocystis sp. subtype 1]
MGVIGFTGYLEKRKEAGIDAIGGVDSVSLLSKDNKIPAVMDGNAFESSVVERVLKRGTIVSPFSYQTVYNTAKSILDTVKSCHVVIMQVFVDGIEDPDKAEEKKKRHSKKSKGNQKLLSVLKNNPKAHYITNLSTPLISRYAVKNAIMDCYPDVQFFSGGVDCDRDIAKYAKEQKCYVITGDCDFFVFDVPGVIHLKWMMEKISNCGELDSIDVYPHDRMLERLNLNCSSIRYLAFLCGNDFVDSVGIDVDANVQICQGVGDSYEAVVKDATQRFPELEDVEKSMRKVWKKYDLDSYPEFPQSCLRDCVANNDAGEEVEEQAAEAIEQLLPEFIDSFHILNSSSSLNYIFSPVITLPVPYKKDDAYMTRVTELKVRMYCFLGDDQEDPYVIVPANDKDLFKTEYFRYLKKHSSIVNRRVTFCQKVRDLPAMDRLALLKKMMHPVFNNLVLSPSLLDEDQSSTLFSTVLIQVVQYLYPQGYGDVIAELLNMLDGYEAHVVKRQYERAFLAFDALQCALDAITALFEILLLPIPMDVIERIDLTKLLK